MNWLDESKPSESWMGVWTGKFTCSNCSAIINDHMCPICNYEYNMSPTELIDKKGNVHKIYPAFAGAISYITYTYINLIQREWERPLSEEDTKMNAWSNGIPQRFNVVLLFWSLFEHLMEKLITDGLKNIPEKIALNLMKRYSTVSSHMGQLYNLTFSSNFKDDLIKLEYEYIYTHLSVLREKRNEFIHGNPQALNTNLVFDTMKYFQDSQQAWIDLYNMKCHWALEKRK